MNKKYLRLSAIALVVVFTGVLVSRGFIEQAHASLTTSKVTITDSRSQHAATGHTFNFTTATAGTIGIVTFEYWNTATGTTVPSGLVTTAAVQGSPTGLSASTSNVTTNGTITLTVTTPALIGAGVPITVPYTNITNPNVDSSTTFVRITTKTAGAVAIDSTIVAFAVLTPTSVTMSASVDPTFQFSLTPVTGAINSATTNITTTANTIPFGTLTSGSTKIGAIDTTVVTNAGGGYTITIAAAADPPLADGTNNIDYHTLTNLAPGSWTSPAGVTANVNTGFVGYTTNETTLGTGTAGRFVGNKWAGLRNVAEEVVYLAGGTTTRTMRVGFQAEVNALQPAGSYAGTVLLVATPTY